MSHHQWLFNKPINLIINQFIIKLRDFRIAQYLKPELNMKKIIRTLLALVLTTQVIAVQAQDDAFQDLTMNGLSSLSKLRKEYYLGALFLESLSTDTQSIVNMDGKKRMEMRIVIDKWSPRRFSKQWNEAIYLNNDPEVQEEFADQIQAFIDIAQDDLKAGDIIIIDMDPNSGTSVYLDGQRILKSSNNEFFYVLLNTWIGNKPPSSDFKQNILSLPSDETSTALLVKFDSLGYDDKRKKEIAAWSKPAKKESTSVAAPATLALSASAAAALPSSGTRVTAKSTQSKTKAKATQSPPTATKLDAPKPVIDIVEPTLAKTATTAPKPAKEEVKPAVIKEAPQPAGPTEQELAEQKQQSLKEVYRSNILKLTYQNTIYPKRSISLSHEGMVIYKVTVNRSGKLTNLEEEQLTEHSLLNKAARKAIKKASPFPEAPDDLKGNEFVFSLPFNFKL